MNHSADKGKPPADNRDITNTTKNAARNTTLIFETRQTGPTKPEAESPKWSDEERTYYRRYLRTQRAIVLITLGGIALALFTLRALNKSVSAANRQADAAATQAQTARQEFELSERPWVSADPIQFSDLTFDKTAGHFTIRFLLKNTGHSPAAHAHIEAQLTPIKVDQIFKEPLERQKQLCDAARYRNTTGEFAAFTLFPGGQTTRDVVMSMAQADIANAEFRPPNTKERPFIVPIIVGCIDYQFEFKPGHHQTGFLYTLYRFEGKNRPGVRIYPGQNLPVSRLMFEPFAFGGSYAD
jgi:hypothetical protein